MNYDGYQFCKCDTTNFGGAMAKWESPIPGQPVELAIGIAEYVPSLTHEALKGAFLTAASRISAVCGLRFIWVDDANVANIKIILMPQSDGPGGVLADCQLAQPGFRTDRDQVILRIDPKETLCVADNPPVAMLDIVRIGGHEMIHGTGIGHLGMGNWMQPSYDLKINSPQTGDIVELVARYGPFIASSSPTNTGASTDYKELSEVLWRNGRYFGKLIA